MKMDSSESRSASADANVWAGHIAAALEQQAQAQAQLASILREMAAQVAVLTKRVTVLEDAARPNARVPDADCAGAAVEQRMGAPAVAEALAVSGAPETEQRSGEPVRAEERVLVDQEVPVEAVTVAGAASVAPEQQPAAPERAAGVSWTPRPVDELERELEQIGEVTVCIKNLEPTDLARFKEAWCRFRGAWEERKRHVGAQDPWHDHSRCFVEKQKALWPDEYLIPRSADVRLVPDRWRELAELYGDLAQAVEALAWIERTRPRMPRHWVERECGPLLEAIGAVSAHMYRWLQRHLPGQRDDQQDRLHCWLRDIGQEYGLFIRSLQPADRVQDSELESLVRELPARLEALRGGTAKQIRQAEALERLRDLLHREGFGGQEEDGDDLCEVAFECLGAGVPPTDRRLRDPLLAFGWMLAQDPALARLHKAVADELARRARKEIKQPDGLSDHDGTDDLPEDLRAKLQEVRRITRGLCGAVVGGKCHESSRLTIEEALQLDHLTWPDTESCDLFDPAARDFRRADLILLTRFNRKSSREARRLCKEQDKILLCLPTGYGLHQVISRAHQQLYPAPGA
jgi:hypothetical protein